MRLSFPSFFKSASIYTFANLLKAAVPFFLLPILTTYLSTNEYGTVAMFQVMATIFRPLTGLNANSAIEREYFDRSKSEMPYFVGNGVLLILLSTILLTFIVIIFNNTLSALSTLSVKWLLSLVAFSISQNICEVLLSLWKVSGKAKEYGIFRVLRTLLELSISIILVVWFIRGSDGRLEGIVLSAIIFGALSIFLLKNKRYVRISINWDHLKSILKFGVPLIPHVLGGALILYSDRFFITYMYGAEATGLYTVGYQIGMAVYLLESSFNLAWTPWLFRKLNENNDLDKVKIVKFTYLYFLFMITCVVALFLVLPFIFALLVPNKAYLEGQQFVIWIASVFALDGMYKMVVNYIFYIKKTAIISAATFGTALVNIILNYFFVKHFGPIGAAQASVISLFLQFTVVWIISASLYKMPWLYFLNKSIPTDT